MEKELAKWEMARARRLQKRKQAPTSLEAARCVRVKLEPLPRLWGIEEDSELAAPLASARAPHRSSKAARRRGSEVMRREYSVDRCGRERCVCPPTAINTVNVHLR